MPLKVRDGVLSVAAVALLLWAPQASAAQSDVFDVQEIVPGVWAALVLPMPPMYVFANALVVEQVDGLGVVDSHSSPSAARAMIAEIEARTGKPVRWLLNSHFHGDHVYGNEVYARRYPGLRIIAQENAARDIEAKLPSTIEEEMDGLPPSIEQREEWLRTGTGPGGEALTAEQVIGLERSVLLRRNHLAELREMQLTVPTETFADELRLDDAGAPVTLLYFGPAHTDGDALAYLPNQKILSVGDLLEDALPWVDENTHPAGWADVLDRVAELDIQYILPSHGGLHRGRAVLERQRAFFRYVVDAVRVGIEEGRSLEEIRSGVDPDLVPKPLEEGDPGLRGWEEYVGSVVAHTYRDLGGEMPSGG